MPAIHPAIEVIQTAIQGTPFQDDLWIVGGAVRDALLGVPPDNDFDLVTRGSASELANLLYRRGLSSQMPVTYERFGTAMVRISDANIELVTARRESYATDSRKPTVKAASIEEDAARRDFTVNTLLRGVTSGLLTDPLGVGVADLETRVLRTPLDPSLTFRDDPLRMLRAVRFRWKLGFEPAPGLYEAIRANAERLKIISNERIRDELTKMLTHPTAADALNDLLQLGLLAQFAPELVPMVGCEQGKWHHLDAWDHTLLVVRNVVPGSLTLALAALLHDVGKPSTRTVDDQGDTRFFSHEVVGAEIADALLRRLRFSGELADDVALLVRNHMRLGSFREFTPSAARRLLRDLGPQTDDLLTLVEADAKSLKPGVRIFDSAPIRERLKEVQAATPREVLDSPLTGQEIMEATGLAPGRDVGRIKSLLTDQVLDGGLPAGDKDAALAWLRENLPLGLN